LITITSMLRPPLSRLPRLSRNFSGRPNADRRTNSLPGLSLLSLLSSHISTDATKTVRASPELQPRGSGFLNPRVPSRQKCDPDPDLVCLVCLFRKFLQTPRKPVRASPGLQPRGSGFLNPRVPSRQKCDPDPDLVCLVCLFRTFLQTHETVRASPGLQSGGSGFSTRGNAQK
jgi:hypothetical protein